MVPYLPQTKNHAVCSLSSMMQGKEIPFWPRGDYFDPTTTALMTGGNFEDGSGRGLVPMRTVGDGACLFNGTSAAAFGMKCRSPRGVKAHALPIRVACIVYGLKSMENLLDMDRWGWFYRTLHAYDAAMVDRALSVGLDTTADGLLPVDTARVLFLFSVQAVAGEFKDAQQFCFPLIADTLHLNLRVFHPGVSSLPSRWVRFISSVIIVWFLRDVQPSLTPRVRNKTSTWSEKNPWSPYCYVDVFGAVLSVNEYAHQQWCHHLFAPGGGSRRPSTPTIYLAMTLIGGRSFQNVQEFEKAYRVPGSPDKNGQPRYTHAYPDCRHFVYVLPPADAEKQLVGVLIDFTHPFTL